MSFLDKAKAAAEQAATMAKEGIEDLTTKRELNQAYSELGRVAYSLQTRGEITHTELEPLAARVTELEAKAGPA
jgi:hypothetical protein